MATARTDAANILHTLIADDSYHAMFNRFTMEGKGRRPDATSPILTNRVFVQLWDIMLRNGQEQKKVQDWFGYLYDGLFVSPDRLCYVISAAYSQALRLVDGPRGVLISFLDEVFDFNFVSNILSQVQIDRKILLGNRTDFKKPKDFKLSNGIVLELDKIKRLEKLDYNFTAHWIFFLINETEPREVDKNILKTLHRTINKLNTQKKKIQSNKKLNANDYEKFLEEEFVYVAKQNLAGRPTENLTSEPSTCTNPNLYCNDMPVDKIPGAKGCDQSNFELLKNRIASLEKQLAHFDKIKRVNIELKREVKNLKRKISRDSIKIASKHRYLQNSERKRKLVIDEKEKIIHNLEESLEVKKRKIKSLAEERKNVIRNYNDLNEKIFKQQTLHEVEVKTGENNAYSDNIRQVVILLQSVAGVAAENVSKVIRIVGKYIFDHEFDNLPSAQSCLNMNAEGLVLSDMQIAEKILDSNHVTLHLDGTSRDHQKVVGHQVTLDDGSNLYLGFTLVAQEDSKTLFDITLSLLKRISHLRSEMSSEDEEVIFKTLLKKIKNTMSDRAAVMKCFDRELDQFLKSELGEEFELNFLHCNAHFLLGMSDVTDKAMREVEDNIKQATGAPIGRDKDAQFSRFYVDSESCCNRLIRLLCDILGPRGDQKSGCKVEWKEFCSDSKIPCFKSNRFNCFFEAAASIIHHYDKIRSFLSSGVLGKSNQKIQSVSQDIEDLNLISCICALGLFYLKVSGPYWKLVNSSTSYSDFCHLVRKMHRKFLEWSSSASSETSCQADLLCESSDDLFGPNFSLSSSVFSSSLYSFLNSHYCNIPILKQCLKSIFKACADVTSRQLGNFLDGSFDPDNEALAECLRNCPLTNLIGESSFGDLDYDIRKRANCSYLQRTASHCIKRNKTCSDYLDCKSKGEKAEMFSVARRQRQSLVEEAKSNEVDVSIKIKERMVANQQKKIEKAASNLEKHGELMRRVEFSGGVCQNGEDVDNLLEKLSTSRTSKKQITEAIKDQIRYYKAIRNIKDKNLNLSGSLEDLISKLKHYLLD